MEDITLLAPAFFLTALVYSMAGFGGGSTYLALLALFVFPYESMPKVALLCNLVVVSGGCWFFGREGHLPFRKLLPFLVTSIPMAYLGGRMPIDKTFFFWLLGLSLFCAALRLFLSDRTFEPRSPLPSKRVWGVGLPIGGLLGLISGLVGIGGGIFLSPLLLLMGWTNAKQSAAAASLFILLNSLSGLAGQFAKGGWPADFSEIILLMLAVFLGGQIGSRLGSQKIPKLALQRITGGVILFVSFQILRRALL